LVPAQRVKVRVAPQLVDIVVAECNGLFEKIDRPAEVLLPLLVRRQRRRGAGWGLDYGVSTEREAEGGSPKKQELCLEPLVVLRPRLEVARDGRRLVMFATPGQREHHFVLPIKVTGVCLQKRLPDFQAFAELLLGDALLLVLQRRRGLPVEKIRKG